MASSLLFGFCVVCNLIDQTIEEADNKHIEDLFSFSITDLLNNHQTIQSYSNQLKETGAFRIENILNSNAVTYLTQRLKQSPMAPSDAWTNAWQANTINKNYPTDHPINFMTRSKNHYIGRSVIPQIFIDLYEYDPILQVFAEILSIQHGYKSLHLSTDLHGSVYGRIGKDGDGGAWHFDQHPFSCVWLLQKPLNEGGGQLRWAHMPPIKYERENGTIYKWDWDLMGRIYAKDKGTWDKHVKQMTDANTGDVYCFQGNETLHDITPVVGEQERIVFVTAYSESAHFKHDNIVAGNNNWDKYDGDIEDIYVNNDINSVHVEL